MQKIARVLCMSAAENICHQFFSCQYSAYKSLFKLKLGPTHCCLESFSWGRESYFPSKIQRQD